jgi:phage terminase large subunit GpA-like protein
MRHATFPAIPPFETGHQIVARLAFLARPKEKLSVSAWAAKHLNDYDADALPFLAEIMDACGAPETCEVGDMGPAQGGKSKVGEAFIGWTIDQDPAGFMVVQPDKFAMESFIKLRINQMISSISVLKEKLAATSNADNMFIKLFRGMSLMSGWPVENFFRQRTAQRGWLDDYDGFPTNADGQVDIEGKGDGISQLDGRMTVHKGRDTKLVSSSPALGVDAGIEPFIAGGTDERLWPTCPQCEERWEIDLIRDLRFDKGTPEKAAESAYVVCPSGCILPPSARHQLLASLKDLPNRGFIAKHPERGHYRRTFRRDGLLAFTPWTELARAWREAQIAWEARQDEAPLRTFYNVKAGKNYRSQLSGEEPVRAEELKGRREKDWRRGTVPRGVRVVNAVVDVQRDRFECALIGSGAERETWLIDRFPVDVLDDGLTQVAPFVHKEHFKVLLGLFDRLLPLAEVGPDGKPVGYARILSVVVDTGGSDRSGDQATEGAKWFWNAARALGVHPSRITLMKGGSNPTGPLMPPGKFADQKLRSGAQRSSARLWIPNVNAIKNMIDARLRRTVPGPGYIHFPGDLPADATIDGIDYFEEITAEELVKGKWKPIRRRNETWDNLVQGEVALLKPPFAQSRTDMRWVPTDYRVVWPKTAAPAPAPAVKDQPTQTAPPAPESAPAPKRAQRVPSAKRRRGKSWMGRLS